MPTAAVATHTRFENILFATDFSDAAAQAVPYVKHIAKHYQSNIVALHVRPPLVNPMTQLSTWPIDVEAVRNMDADFRKELNRAFAGCRAEIVIQEGEVVPAVEAAIDTHHVDLLVMGTRGRTGLGKLLMGSIAEDIFRNVTCPVLTVGPHALERGRHGEFREILYATDFSSESGKVAAYALSLAREFQARLVLLHVITEPKPGELVVWSDVEKSAKKVLRSLVPDEAEAWCKAEFFVERGDAAERILDLANLRESDLIILGTQAETGMRGAATNLPIAIAHRIVSRASCPVLTVRHS
jgi:nucleotide-binding universal stress UspA family protein